MPIVSSQLVTTNDLQEYLVDKSSGLPLAGGKITLWQDNARTVLKNWYYQTGNPPNYSYLPLPNPLILSSIGTITDPNSVDTLPFYYPFSETDNVTRQAYYITVDSAQGTRQFTRQNFPFGSDAENPVGSGNPQIQNYVFNNQFWRNIGSLAMTSGTTLTTYGFVSNNINLVNGGATTWFSKTLAPSQHDGFEFSDFQYIKDSNAATETITFTKFGNGNIPLNANGDITPEYYINHTANSVMSGENYKFYQFPISLHINTLQDVQGTITFEAMGSGGANNNISISLFQSLGTGVQSPNPVLQNNGTSIQLSNVWQKFSLPITFDSSEGLVQSAAGDDAWYIQIGMPLNSTGFTINFTLPSLYLCQPSQVPTNSFTTYDQVDSIINSPRTGDFRISLNSFLFGWVAANDGTIGALTPVNSNATNRANNDTWPLYNFIWTLFNGNQSLAPMFTSAATPIAYGISAYADFIAGNAISLTKAMGRAISGIGLASGQTTTWAVGQTAGAESHIVTLNEMPNHTHNQPIGSAGFTSFSGAASTASGANLAFNASTATGNVTGYATQTALALYQPTSFYNILFKL